MDINEPKKAEILYFLSSSEDEDEDAIEFIFNTTQKNIKPKISNYTIDVVHNYSDKQVNIIYRVIDFT